MFRFILDFFRFPFQKETSENKFAEVLNFIIRDFPVYFWVKKKLRKILAFPFIVLYLIFRKKKYEKIWFFWQLLIVLILWFMFFINFWYKWSFDGYEFLEVFKFNKTTNTNTWEIINTWQRLELIRQKLWTWKKNIIIEEF